jgi:hypothetical protein
MDFLSQTFTFNIYYQMCKMVFDKIGYNRYIGLKNKFPPIRYLGTDANNNELIIFAHPRDFLNRAKEFKLAFDNIILNSINEKYLILDKKSEIYEIYPSLDELLYVPNGFIALFMNECGINMLLNEFNINNEVGNLFFEKVNESGININNIKLCGVAEPFIRKFNTMKHLINKYKNLYLVMGDMRELNIKNGYSKNIKKLNIIGGKRLYDETTIDGTIREVYEELGLNTDSKILKLVKTILPKSRDILKFISYNVYCIYITPNY